MIIASSSHAELIGELITDVRSLLLGLPNTIPFFNSKSYLHTLTSYVNRDEIRQVMIIVGPKDSGKSEGISQLKSYWQKEGHMLIDVNLKGESYNVNTKMAMTLVSKEVMNHLQNSENHSNLLSLYNNASLQCLDHYVPGLLEQLIRWMASNVSNVMSLVAGTITFLFFGRFFANVQRLYRHFKLTIWTFLIIMLCLIGTLFIIAFIWSNIDPNYVQAAIQPVDVLLRNGNWKQLMCFLNYVAQHHIRPILIIREVINLDGATMYECFKAMERTKEGGIQFPIIFETSDNLWYQVPAMKKSRMSFHPYYIKEMSFEEGKVELVERLQIWSLDEYENIYDKIGGHCGSYSLLWLYAKLGGDTIEEGLKIMQKREMIHLHDCLIQGGKENLSISDIIATLQALKLNNFMLTALDINPTVTYLIDCNILFYDGVNIFPQKRLLLNVIDEFLDQNATKKFLAV